MHTTPVGIYNHGEILILCTLQLNCCYWFQTHELYVSQWLFTIIIVIGSAVPNLSLQSISLGGKQHTYNDTIHNHGWLTVMISLFQHRRNGLYVVVSEPF